jgi:exosortase A
MSAVPADLRIASPWRTALPAIAVVLLALIAMYRDTAAAMVDIWSRSETFAHAWLVPPIVLWLVWRQRAVLARIVPRPMPLLLVLLAGAAAAWTMADLVVVNAATQFAFVGMLVLAVPAVLGLEVARAILFPLLFSFFAVPFGEFMLPPMMDWTADFVVLALQVTGIPVFREGLYFVIPSGSWSVIDECSGVRYLIASFMVGSLFAYLNYRSYTRRAAFMAVSIAMPILANWLRAYIIVMLGHLSGNKIAVGVDHILYGWVFFGIVIFAMFMIGMRWAEPDAPAPAAEPATAAAARAAAFDARPLVATAAALLALAALPHALLWGLQRAEAGAAAAKMTLPDELAPGWRRGDVPDLPWAPNWLEPSAVDHRWFDGPAGRVGVYVAYYRGQGPDRKLVSSLNGVVHMNNREWNPVGRGSAEVPTPSAAVPLQATRILAPQPAGSSTRPHLVAWRVYWIDGRWVAGDAAAKIHNALARLRGRGDDGAAIVVYAERDSFDAATAALSDFGPANLPAIGELMQRTRDAR